jgi:hypothetical protein
MRETAKHFAAKAAPTSVSHYRSLCHSRPDIVNNRPAYNAGRRSRNLRGKARVFMKTIIGIDSSGNPVLLFFF